LNIMIKIGVADYGLNVWYGKLYDYKDRLEMLKNIGYDGIERLEASNPYEAIEAQACALRMGMDFGTCRASTSKDTIHFSAALGKKYIWTDSNASDFDAFCRNVNYHTEAAGKYGLKVGLHNHLGSLAEKTEEVEAFLRNCPNTGLILDTGHIAGAGGDPLYFVEKYFDRLAAVHVKDYVYKIKDEQRWYERLRFCELGAGEMGDINKAVITTLIKKGYDGWIYVEHDTHLQDPVIDLKISREYIRECGI